MASPQPRVEAIPADFRLEMLSQGGYGYFRNQVVISADGVAKLSFIDGQQLVEKTRRFTSAETVAILNKFRDSDFSSFGPSFTSEKECPFFGADGPYFVITLTAFGETKEVRFSHNCRTADGEDLFPKELDDLRANVYRLIDPENWSVDQ